MDEKRSVFVAIVGAGMSGITMAAQILKQNALTRDEFKIFDGNDDYGGVWQANQYPGAACDVPSHAYVLRFHLKPGKSRSRLYFGRVLANLIPRLVEGVRRAS